MTLADRLCIAARAMLGAPYRHEGRSLNGLDCVGLLICCARTVGVVPADFDVRGYPRRPRDHSLTKWLGSYCDRISTRRKAPGDVVAFVGSERLPCHVGILLPAKGHGAARPRIIHASEEEGRVIEHDLTTGRLIGCWRPKENMVHNG